MLRRTKILMAFLFPFALEAGQMLAISNNEEGLAQIARTSLSRIYVQDDNITQVTSMNGELMIQKDVENGQLFVKPIDEGRERPIDIFISTEKGNHFALSLKPLTISSQNIGLYLKNDKARRQSEEIKVLAFVKELQQKTPKVDKEINPRSEQVISFNPYKLIRLDTVNKGSYIGEIYQVENYMQENLPVEQKDFWQTGVKAVAIEKEALRLGQATKVFVVKTNG